MEGSDVEARHRGPLRNVRNTYDRVAADYAEQFKDELSHKPFDLRILDWLVEKAGAGTLCDMGCGPGQIARYLADRGADVCGIDVSPAMVREARKLHPNIPFHVGDFLALRGVADSSFAGIAAFYSIVHLDPGVSCRRSASLPACCARAEFSFSRSTSAAR